MKFKVIITEDLEDGGYNVFCPSLTGCHSQGDTMEEALKNIKDAIELYLEPGDEIGLPQQNAQVAEVIV
jgi:predicted RNase H-like HicB family nuclease